MWIKHCCVALMCLFAQAVQASEIVVAQIADYSASRAPLGAALKAGAEMVFAKVNAAGGVGGRKIRFVTRDDQYKPEETVRLLEKVLAEQKPALILGVLGTANTGAVLKAGILERAHVPLIAPYTGADSLRTPVNPWVFHVRASYAEEVERIVKHYATLGLTKLAILHEDDPFGQFIYSAFDKAAAKYPFASTTRLTIARGSTDMTAAIAELKQANVQGIVIGTAGQPTAAFIRQLGLAKLSAFRYALSVNDTASIIAAAGLAHAHGFGQVQVMPDPTSGCKLQICRTFLADYQHYGDKAVPPSPSMMEGYVAARLAVAALERTAGSPDGQAVQESISRTGRFEIGGFELDFSNGKRAGSQYTDLGMISRSGRMMY
ncbi:ABC transporter substrate-binding protein [Noviherbaspirillum sp.]|uniref:ABC transporter substrate-binding protein n=1 Tax=Noviherbaspirillum sp. TaxID=1926288 RepID=UPI0025E8ABD4|nr:ABC transporter substrate-binding protein [Noviherbaspirillum sp.]